MERIPACRRRIAPQLHIGCCVNYQILRNTIGTSAMCSQISANPFADFLPTFCRLFAGFLPTFCRPSSTNTKGNQLNASGVGCMERIPVCRLRIAPQIHIACYANYQILMKTIGTSSMYSKILPGLGKSFCRLFADFLPTFCRLFADFLPCRWLPCGELHVTRYGSTALAWCR